MPKSIAFIDGKYISLDPQTLDAFTPGHFQARGVFETLRVIDHHVELLDEHLMRLRKGLNYFKIHQPYSGGRLKAIAKQVVLRNLHIKLGRLRLMAFTQGKQTHMVVMLVPQRPLTKTQYARGLHVCLVPTHRPASAKHAFVKSLDYGLFAQAYAHAKAQGYDEALLLNTKGHIFEASRANIFIYTQGQWITPPLSSGCLNGIVRQKVLRIAQELKILIIEKNITPAMFKSAQGAFLTNSLIGLIPITTRVKS